MAPMTDRQTKFAAGARDASESTLPEVKARMLPVRSVRSGHERRILRAPIIQWVAYVPLSVNCC
jgi:hypothetical protein